MGCVFSGTLSILGMPYLLLFTTLWPLSVLFLVWIAYDWNTHIQGRDKGESVFYILSLSPVVLNPPNAVTLLIQLIPRVVATLNHKIISLLLHNCNFAVVMNHHVNI